MDIFLLYTLGITLAVFALYFIGILLAPYAPGGVKDEHFECGLPAGASQPKRANFGFFTYAILFVIADMTGLFITLFVYADRPETRMTAAAFAVIMAVAVTIAMKEYSHAEDS